MKIFLTIIFIFFFLNLFAQKQTFSDCDPSKKLLFVRVEYPAQYADSLSSLKDRIDEFFEDKLNRRNKGSVIVSLIIYSDGTFCCSQIDNTSDVVFDFDDLKNYINSNLKWSSAMQNDKHVGSIKLLTITFKKHHVAVMEKN